MFGMVNNVFEMYEVTLQSTGGSGCGTKIECINAEKGILMCLPNLRFTGLKERSRNLREWNVCEYTKRPVKSCMDGFRRNGD